VAYEVKVDISLCDIRVRMATVLKMERLPPVSVAKPAGIEYDMLTLPPARPFITIEER